MISNNRANEKLEEALYDIIANELLSGNTSQGLWLKSTIESGGNEHLTMVIYTKLRMAQLIRESIEEANNIAMENAELVKLSCPYCKTYVGKDKYICPNCRRCIPVQR